MAYTVDYLSLRGGITFRNELERVRMPLKNYRLMHFSRVDLSANGAFTPQEVNAGPDQDMFEVGRPTAAQLRWHD